MIIVPIDLSDLRLAIIILPVSAPYNCIKTFFSKNITSREVRILCVKCRDAEIQYKCQPSAEEYEQVLGQIILDVLSLQSLNIL